MPAGRPKGSMNKKSRINLVAAKYNLKPLDYMLQILNDDDEEPAKRFAAATAAAPYCHARLSQVETRDVTEYDGNPDSITTDQLAAIVSGAGRSHDAAKKKGKGKLH